MLIENLPLIIDAGIAIVMGLLDGIIKALPLLLAYIPTLIGKILTALAKIIPKLFVFAKDLKKTIQKPFVDIATWFGKKFGEAVSKIKEKFAGIKQFFANVRDKIKGVFQTIGGKVGGAIKGAFKTAINGALSLVESAINKIPNTINNALGAINKILPKDKQLGRIPTVQLPRVMATGGVTTGITNAIIGDNPSHNEAVLPLDSPQTIKLFREALSGIGTGGTVNQTINVGQMNSYREAYLIKRATEQGLKRMMRATV